MLPRLVWPTVERGEIVLDRLRLGLLRPITDRGDVVIDRLMPGVAERLMDGVPEGACDGFWRMARLFVRPADAKGVGVMLEPVRPTDGLTERTVECDRCAGALTFDGVRTAGGLVRLLLATRLVLIPLDRENDGNELDKLRLESADLDRLRLLDGDRVIVGDRELDPKDELLDVLGPVRR
jgi:hypothetical protein